MKVSLKWLQDYVDIVLPPEELAERLTMSGMEVKSLEVIGSGWENIVVGQMVAIDPHPNADRLKLATVDLSQEQVRVVTGAPGLMVGDKVPFARLGAHLIDGHTGQVIRLKSAKIRGILSDGMVCSEKELGISDSHEGIMILPAEAPVGAPLADYLGDTILDLEVTPNRPDCLSLIGIAREIAALTGQCLRLPQVAYEELGVPVVQVASVEIVASDLCPRDCARSRRGEKLASSPHWMQQRLLACGMRPINNIVDVTNYVMLEYGQPLHSFDFGEIRDGKIIVRRARDGEGITSLDGVERDLTGDMLVIADLERAVAVAGVMGGADSEVTSGTASILLESANFNQASIHRTSGGLRLRSEASSRFEKGISPELPPVALRRATPLILELAGGKVAGGIIDIYPGEMEREKVLLPISEFKRLLGIEFSVDQAAKALGSLGFDCQRCDSELRVTVPYWRTDVGLAADLVEEVARIIGYDQIPTTMLRGQLPAFIPDPVLALEERIRDVLVSLGFQEVITYSLTNLEMLKKLTPQLRLIGPAPIHIANPLTGDQEYLRTTLRARLLMALSFNQKYEVNGVRLFEVGRIYLPRDRDLPEERDMLCAAISGSRDMQSWLGGDDLLDFFDVKGAAEALLYRLGVKASFEAGNDESLHPGRTARIVIGGDAIGVIGELHPKVARAFELSTPVCLFEVDLVKLLPFTLSPARYQPLPRFPGTLRDIALVVDAAVASHKLQHIIEGSPLVSQVTLFDVYSGEQVPQGKKSLAYRIIYQSTAHTLTDEEVDQAQQEILDRLYRELGATLRG